MKKRGIIYLLFALLSVFSLEAQVTPYVGSWYVDEDVSDSEESGGIIRTQFTFEQDMNMDIVIVVLLSSPIDEGVTLTASLGGVAVGKWEQSASQLMINLDVSSFELTDTDVEFEGLQDVEPMAEGMMKRAVADQLRAEFEARFSEVVASYAHCTFSVVSVDENQLVVVDESNEQTTFYRFEPDDQ